MQLIKRKTTGSNQACRFPVINRKLAAPMKGINKITAAQSAVTLEAKGIFRNLINA